MTISSPVDAPAHSVASSGLTITGIEVLGVRAPLAREFKAAFTG